MFCSNCGKQIPDNSRFCENCGSRVEIENTLQPPRQEHQWSALQSHVEEETFTESPRQWKKPGFVPLVLIFAAITVGVLFLKDFLDNEEPKVYTPDQIQQSAQTDSSDSTQLSQQQPVQADTPPVQADTLPEQVDTPPVQADTPSVQTDDSAVQGGTGEYDVSGIEGIEDIGEDDIGSIIERLSTYDRPTLEEFAWYDEVFNNGVWPDATPVTELPYILGGWKCYIVYDPYVNTGSEVQELVNVELSIGSGGASALVDWYQVFWNGDPPYDATDQKDSEFVGSYEDGVFELIGPGKLSIGQFYEYQGKYYGFGTLLAPDGTIADFWMMR